MVKMRSLTGRNKVYGICWNVEFIEENVPLCIKWRIEVANSSSSAIFIRKIVMLDQNELEENPFRLDPQQKSRIFVFIPMAGSLVTTGAFRPGSGCGDQILVSSESHGGQSGYQRSGKEDCFQAIFSHWWLTKVRIPDLCSAFFPNASISAASARIFEKQPDFKCGRMAMTHVWTLVNPSAQTGPLYSHLTLILRIPSRII